MNNSIYYANEPYPEAMVEGKNLYYAEILMDDYAGAESEMTSVTQYMYNSFYLGKTYIVLADMWKEIAFSDMNHMALLADAIILLGGNPVFRGAVSNVGSYWSGSYPYYGTDLYTQLSVNISSKNQAISKIGRAHV